MKGVKVFIAVQVIALLAFAGVVIWAFAYVQAQRESDCQQTLEARVTNTENDVAIWRDVEDILGNDPQSADLFDALVQRIRDRSQSLPPPAACS